MQGLWVSKIRLPLFYNYMYVSALRGPMIIVICLIIVLTLYKYILKICFRILQNQQVLYAKGYSD